MNFLLARTSLSLTSFSGCARRWIFSQVAHVAAFSPGYACRWFFSGSHESIAHFFFRLRPSLNTFSQVAFVADFFLMLRSSLIFFQVVAIDEFFASSHESVADFFLQVASVADIFHRSPPSLTSISGCGQRWLFPQVGPSLIFPQITPVTVRFPGRTSQSLTSFSEWEHHCFFPRLRASLIFSKLCRSLTFLAARTSPTLTSFSGCARRWYFSQVETVTEFYFRLRTSLTFFPGRAPCWFLTRLRTSLIFFPGRTIPSLTYFSDFARRWLLFHMLRQSQNFLHVALVAVTFFQVEPIHEFFASSYESVTDIFFRLRTSLTFSQVAPVADFFPRLRMSLICFPGRTNTSMTSFSGCRHRWLFSQVAPVAEFSSGYACRWFFFRFARVHGSFFFQVAPVAEYFFTGRVRRSLFLMLRSSLIFFQVKLVDELFASSHKSFADFFFRLSPLLTFFTGHAPCWHFSLVAPVADFFFRLRTSLTFSQVAPVADFSPDYACRWFFSGSNEYVADFLLRLRTSPGFPSCADRWLFCQLARVRRQSMTFFTDRARRWLLFQVEGIADFFQVVPIADFFASSHGSVADFYFRLRTSLNFFPGRARCWFFPRLRTSLIFFQVRTIPSLTFLSDCTCRWLLFHRPRQSLIFLSCSCRCYFFPKRAYLWFFASLQESFTDFFFRLRPSLIYFSGFRHGWLFPSLRPSLIFPKLWLSLTFLRLARVRRWYLFSGCACRWFFPSCACRWLFCQLARVCRWLIFQVGPVADIFHRSRPFLISISGSALRWLFPRSRPSLNFTRPCPSLIFP